MVFVIWLKKYRDQVKRKVYGKVLSQAPWARGHRNAMRRRGGIGKHMWDQGQCRHLLCNRRNQTHMKATLQTLVPRTGTEEQLGSKDTQRWKTDRGERNTGLGKTKKVEGLKGKGESDKGLNRGMQVRRQVGGRAFQQDRVTERGRGSETASVCIQTKSK